MIQAQQQSTTPPELLAPDCALWEALIQHRCGLFFSDSRRRFLHQSLWKRMCLHGLQNYREYYNYVAVQPGGQEEWEKLLELLLNHETGFFRHGPSFGALTEHVLPALMRDRPRGSTITMWSAGCSIGQEAYSLAMAFLELTAPAFSHLPLLGHGVQSGWRVKITGSDISPLALTRARQGQYKLHEIRTLPDHYRQRYFTVVDDTPPAVYQVTQRVQELVEFAYANLHDLDSLLPLFPVAMRGSSIGLDVIFCQNVLIYFSRATRLDMVQQLCRRLRPGGYLFLGPAEMVGVKLPDMQPMRLTDTLIYQRTP